MPSVLGEHAIGRHTRRADPTCPRCYPLPEWSCSCGHQTKEFHDKYVSSIPPIPESALTAAQPSHAGSMRRAVPARGAPAKVPQTTRMLKVTCAKCGCIVRMTRKWLDDAGTPVCGCGGRMSEEVA